MMKNAVPPISNLPPSEAEEKLFKGSATTKRGGYAAISYMTCAALSSYNFPSANVVTLLQIICSCSLLYVMKRRKIINFTINELSAVSDNTKLLVPSETFMHTIPISVAYLLYMVSRSAYSPIFSVRGVNVPVYTTLRRTTVVFTMVAEWILASQKYTSSVIGSVGLIVLGAFVAGARDLSFDFYGYFVVFLANITTAIYLATIACVGKSSGLNSFGLMWCNGFVCGPLLLIWAFLTGDLVLAMRFPYLFSPGFMVVLFCSCMLAFFLNYSIFLNTTLNSALTQTIWGNLKDLFPIGLGWMIFGGLPFVLLNVIGQLLGFICSGRYASFKLIGK
ncbi:hypothetical protein MLD38_006405 [Melastoma candidum]|uniref:Uncharacterized protein n=1 Tax=Melastoma candidum TaxID=119954 RepID=A0ACB9RPP7_9MYRT|nr:hypothetical protein MLD38_006405 [Melastoma candidum]